VEAIVSKAVSTPSLFTLRLGTFALAESPESITVKERKMIAKRAQEMTPFLVMDVLERARAMEKEGIHVIHLEVGEPEFDTPQCVKEAACKALNEGHTHYIHSLGILELREAICKHYLKTYNVSVFPDQVVVTSGTLAMFLIFSVLLEKDDEVIISDPHYACYPNFIRFVQGVPVMVRVYEKDGFQYRPESIKTKSRTRLRPSSSTPLLIRPGISCLKIA
jgi:aspartate/methionine/tyrosine aminotransferase